MPTTETFYVSSKDNKIKRTNRPDREFFGNGEKSGDAKYLIEVFGYNHLEEAKKVKEMVENSKFNKLVKIRVEV